VAQLGLFRAGGGLARYQNVVTHPAARGQGLAGTLAAWAARYGEAELGAATLVIVADPEHVAARVYASIGFTPAEEQLGFQRGPVTA
jgi:predicted GNAT family acetyltransferase